MRQIIRQRVFDVRVRAAHVSLFSACIILLELFRPYGTIGQGITLAWLLIFAIRGARSATILLSDSMLRVRTLAFTRSWPAAQVEAFVADTRSAVPGGWLGFGLSFGFLWFVQRPRRMLGIRFRGGGTLWLPEFKSRLTGKGERTWVDEQADLLNNALQHEDRATEPST
jgi:hypothetical protein